MFLWATVPTKSWHSLLSVSSSSRSPFFYPDISYSFYEVYCSLFEIENIRIPLTEDFSISLPDYERPNGGIIFPNPNAPTGKLLALDQIEKLLARNSETVIIVDEAYIDFGGDTAIQLIGKFPKPAGGADFFKIEGSGWTACGHRPGI